MKLANPFEFINSVKVKLGKNDKFTFVTAFVAGLLTHMSIMVKDIPNHDGLESIYFNQNMITSGRWFLCPASGISSFYSVPWLIGVISLVWLSITAVLFTKILEINTKLFCFFAAVLAVSFPVLTSNFAYIFTMDGYMLGLLLCVLAVYMVLPVTYGRIKPGRVVFGAIFLGTGMGCYQSYISVAMVLCLFVAVRIVQNAQTVKKAVRDIGAIVLMGIGGVAFYYVMLKLLLLVQGKELAAYQGIDGMSSTNGIGLLGTVKQMYSDFITFTFKGHVFVPNFFTAAGITVIIVLFGVLFILKLLKKKEYRGIKVYISSLVFVALLPCVTNAILIISSSITYHALMRYQWVVILLIMLASVEKSISFEKGNFKAVCMWMAAASAFLVSFSYIVTDNVAYSNLEKKYEKTYAYCIRLADRIESTEGYYQGMPIAMVGVVGLDNFPATTVTEDVTGSLIGLDGDFLLWKGEHYRDFFKYYLGITINVLGEDYVGEFYNSDFYAEMASFPDSGSIKIVDGIMYIKTENVR